MAQPGRFQLLQYRKIRNYFVQQIDAIDIIMAPKKSTKDIRPISRFITTHTSDGKTSFSDVLPEKAPFMPMADGADFALCYATNTIPVSFHDDQDVLKYQTYTTNLPGITIPGGSVLRVVDFPPGHASPMHRTVSLDYGVVLEGEIRTVLDSGESRLLRRGDIMIQRATNHEWRNESSVSWARMLYVLLPAKLPSVGGQLLEDNTVETIPGVKPPS
jgi:quercetin dioxygenase-like cupin family protein